MMKHNSNALDRRSGKKRNIFLASRSRTCRLSIFYFLACTCILGCLAASARSLRNTRCAPYKRKMALTGNNWRSRRIVEVTQFIVYLPLRQVCMQSMFMFAIQSTCIVWLFSSLKIDTVGMATSPSTQHFHVLFIDDFRERHGSRRHSGVHHLDPFRPLAGQSMNPAVLWTVVSCICCWIVWEKLLIPLACAVCVYRCRRGQIYSLSFYDLPIKCVAIRLERSSVNLFLPAELYIYGRSLISRLVLVREL